MSEKPNISFDDYRAALVKNEALQTEITQLKDQLKDATDALTNSTENRRTRHICF